MMRYKQISEDDGKRCAVPNNLSLPGYDECHMPWAKPWAMRHDTYAQEPDILLTTGQVSKSDQATSSRTDELVMPKCE